MVDVLYTSSKGSRPGHTQLYARMPDLEMAVQQYRDAVCKATTNPLCPYTKVWIKHHVEDYCWTRGDAT